MFSIAKNKNNTETSLYVQKQDSEIKISIIDIENNRHGSSKKISISTYEAEELIKALQESVSVNTVETTIEEIVDRRVDPKKSDKENIEYLLASLNSTNDAELRYTRKLLVKFDNYESILKQLYKSNVY